MLQTTVVLHTPLGDYDLVLEVDEDKLAAILGPPCIPIIGKTVKLLNGAICATAKRRADQPTIIVPPGAEQQP